MFEYIALGIIWLAIIIIVGLIFINRHKRNKKILRSTSAYLQSDQSYSITYKHSFADVRAFSIVPQEKTLTMYTEIEYYSGRKECVISIFAAGGVEIAGIYLDNLVTSLVDDSILEKNIAEEVNQDEDNN